MELNSQRQKLLLLSIEEEESNGCADEASKFLGQLLQLVHNVWVRIDVVVTHEDLISKQSLCEWLLQDRRQLLLCLERDALIVVIGTPILSSEPSKKVGMHTLNFIVRDRFL